MPVLLPPTPLNPLEGLTGRTLANNETSELEVLQVICSFPVSGQYGAGSRILYYVLIAACILARKTEWLRNACLAAALIFPAIAAVHGIVLAALHIDGAVDLDIYGALQLCSIGVLTAPASVRLSNTYFNSEGRSIIFVWSMLVLAGLLALAVEFFRIQSSPCLYDDSGEPVYYRRSDFPYGDTTCNMTCSVDLGPYSPMRDGSADNIYVVPTPNVISFGVATLIAAACCIPGVLSMVSTWNKILKANWAKQFGVPETDEVIEGTNGATLKGMKGVNDVIRRLLSVVEVPVFGGAVIALIVVGEKNFWSAPLFFQTEPMASIGQWWSIGASVLAACGSLYLLLAEYLDRAEKEVTAAYPTGSCVCQCHSHDGSSHHGSLRDDCETMEIPRQPETARTSDADRHGPRRDTFGSLHPLTPIRTDTYPDTEGSAHGLGIRTMDSGSSATGKLMKLAVALGTASSDRFDDYAFRQGKVTSFPEVPGENQRNARLVAIRQQWGETSQEEDDALTPRGRRSRANSISRPNSIGPRAHSLQPPTPTQPSEPGPSVLGLPTSASPEMSSESIFPAGPARPSAELDKTKSQGTFVTLHQGVGSPDIVLSSEDEPGDVCRPNAAIPPDRPPVESLPPRQEDKPNK